MRQFDLLKLTSICNHPKKVVTSKGDTLVVPCGKCLSCLSQKANERKRILMSEFNSHKYCLFVTLTYSNEYLPLMEGCPTNLTNLFEFYSVETGEYLFNYKFKHIQDYYKLLAKAGHDGYLPYSNNRDLQLYIKRLRKHLIKFTNEKIRYYAVSEYGQLHFRPHFHLLVFFDKRDTFFNIRRVCNKVWPFGHVDTQLPKDRRASARYLAQYLNSFLSLPEVFKSRAIKPRIFHSAKLGFVTDDLLANAIREKDYIRVVEYCAHRMGESWSNESINAWRSFKNYLFPKCKGYSLLSDVMRLRLYNLYPYLRIKYFGGKSVTCREIADKVYELYNNNKLTEYEKNRIFIGRTFQECDPPIKENFVAQLYCSRHYHRLCAWLCVSEQRLLRIIDGFYNYCAQYSLKKWYELLQNVSTIDDYKIYVDGAAYTNIYIDDYININGISFDTKELRNLLKHDELHNFSKSTVLSMHNSALKHRVLNETFLKTLQ